MVNYDPLKTAEKWSEEKYSPSVEVFAGFKELNPKFSKTF